MHKIIAPQTHIYLWLVAVDPSSQGEGIGKKLIQFAIVEAKRKNLSIYLETMDEKLDAQLRLAMLISAVDSQDVAQRVLSTHFFRDIRGNLRAYSTQKFRCLKCNRTYRRIPISGKCVCGESKLSLTVRQKNISKYLHVTEKIIHEHHLDQYMQERLRLINSYMDSLFVSEQTSLTDFFDD